MLTYERVVETTDHEFDWLDISTESVRTYHFPGEFETEIICPVALSLSRFGGEIDIFGGSHRIVSADGMSHYIPRGWIRISWRSAPFYVF